MNQVCTFLCSSGWSNVISAIENTLTVSVSGIAPPRFDWASHASEDRRHFRVGHAGTSAGVVERVAHG